MTSGSFYDAIKDLIKQEFELAISLEMWDKAKALFEQGLSLNQIELETEINRSTISKKAKIENWIKAKNQQLKADIKAIDKEKSTLDAKINIAVEKLSKLSDFEITILDEQIQEELGNKSLLFSTANLSLIRKNQMLTKNTKTVLSKVDYFDDEGKKIKTDMEAMEIPLSPNDYKTLDEGIDKNAVTLELAPRHSNSQININNENINAQQNTIRKLTDFYEDLDAN